MRLDRRLMIGLAIVAAMLASGCAKVAEEDEESGDKPATVVPIEGTDLVRVTLTEDAAVRLDLQMDTVSAATSGAANVSAVIPYSAVFYGPSGDTWTYISPEPLTFERAPISIDHIDGNRVYLTKGPAPGTSVVTTGAAELFGTETGVDE